MMKKLLLFALMFMPLVSMALENVVIYGGGQTILAPGEYGVVDIRSGADLLLTDGTFKLWNLNSNQKKIKITVSPTAKVDFMSLNLPGECLFENYSPLTNVANAIELQNGKNIFRMYATLTCNDFQLSDDSEMDIYGCETVLIVKNSANIRNKGKLILSGGEIQAKYMSVDSPEVFFGIGLIVVESNFNLNAKLTVSNQINVCGNLINGQDKNVGNANYKVCTKECPAMPVTWAGMSGKRIADDIVDVSFSFTDSDGSEEFIIQHSTDARNWENKVRIDVKSVSPNKTITRSVNSKTTEQ